MSWEGTGWIWFPGYVKEQPVMVLAKINPMPLPHSKQRGRMSTATPDAPFRFCPEGPAALFFDMVVSS